MESPRKTHAPMPALWIGATNATLDRTSSVVGPLFAMKTLVSSSVFSAEDLPSLSPGYPIILEFEDGIKTREWVEESNRSLHRILAVAEKPVILCLGDQVPAEVVVDWVRAGAFSYVERTADERHIQQAFQATATESATVQEQFVRYEKLRQLWSSITEREASVLNMLMEGLPNKKIANRLGVSQRTIEARRQKLYGKLESRSVVDVVRTIYELGTLEHIFHRIDLGHESSAVWLPNASKLLRSLPRLHSDVPAAHFKNHDELKWQLPSEESE